MGPYKCPECGVWWAGLEHRCRLLSPTAGTVDMATSDDVLWCVDIRCPLQSVRHVSHPASL